MTMTSIQPKEQLDSFYCERDPWNYRNHPDDVRRKTELLSLLPSIKFRRALDIGCGDGFLTFDLPATEVVGTDISSVAIAWAERTRADRPDGQRFSFSSSSLFNLEPDRLGVFDLIVITGVLYPQYIGKTVALIRQKVDALLEEDGIMVSCHINEWRPPRFPYTALDIAMYPYRDYTHRLEIYRK